MTINTLVLTTALFASLFPCAAFAVNQTYEIPLGTIGDHANPANVGSIAWHFQTYGSQNTYILSSDGIYQIGRTLTLPYKTTLTDNGGNAVLRATSALDDGMMLDLASDCTLDGLVIDGREEARIVVNARNRTGVTLVDCVVKRTKNDYVSGNHYPILLDLTKTTLAWIQNCEIYGAGYPKHNGDHWGGTAYTIRARESSGLIVLDCPRISHCLTAGIDITDSINVWIENNTIHDTGINVNYSMGDFADGIVGYHNTKYSDETQLNWTIVDNTIYNSGNHGIHFSGRDILVDGNTVTDHVQRGISFFDFRKPLQYSRDVTITNNVSETGYGETGQDEAIYVDEYIIGTITAFGNSHPVIYGDQAKEL